MLGFAVAGEDMNNDGLNDIAIGAPMAGAPGKSGAGAVYVIFGSHTPVNVATSSLYADGRLTNDPANPAPPSPIGSRYDGIVQDSHTGFSLAALPDVNNDQRGDLAVGAPDGALHINGGGGLVVVYGTSQGVHITLNDLWDKGYPYWFHADFPSQAMDGQHVGDSVALVGDVTGDGWPDIAVGAPQADFNGRANSGSVWIVSGHLPPIDAGCTGMLVDNSCPWIRLWQMDPNQVLRIDGAQAGDGLGSSIAGIGDQNGDGIPDVAIGESGASPAGRPGAGAVVVVPGQRHVAERDLAVSPPVQRIYGPRRARASAPRLRPQAMSTATGTGTCSSALRGSRRRQVPRIWCAACRARPRISRIPLRRSRPAGAGAQTGSSVAAGQSLDGGNRDGLVAAPGVGAFIVGGTGTPILPSGNPPPPPPPAQPAPAPRRARGRDDAGDDQGALRSSGAGPKKKLPLCPLKKPKPRYHTVNGKRVKLKPKACRPLSAKQKARLKAKAERRQRRRRRPKPRRRPSSSADLACRLESAACPRTPTTARPIPQSATPR